MNFAYRALKSDRDGRTLESRLDANESLPWLLDVVFSMAGRVRPYNKYLPWELRTHPVEGWPAEELLDLVARTQAGQAAAIRKTFRRVHAACASYDAGRGHSRTTDMIEGWGSELDRLVAGAKLNGRRAGRPGEPSGRLPRSRWRSGRRTTCGPCRG